MAYQICLLVACSLLLPVQDDNAKQVLSKWEVRETSQQTVQIKCQPKESFGAGFFRSAPDAVDKKGSAISSVSTEFESAAKLKLLLSGEKFRFEKSSGPLLLNGKIERRKFEFVFDGSILYCHYPSAAAGVKRATIHKNDTSRAADSLNNFDILAPMAFYQPSKVLPRDGWKIVEDPEASEKTKQFKMRSGEFEVWVDVSAKEYPPKQIVNRNAAGDIVWQVDIDYRRKAGTLYPSGWKAVYFSGGHPQKSSVVENADVSFEPQLDKKTFTVKFEPGTFVTDNRNKDQDKYYKIGVDGTRLPVKQN